MKFLIHTTTLLGLNFFLIGSSFASESISVVVPACHIFEVQALESATSELKYKLAFSCEEFGGGGLIQNLEVERAACNGFKLTASYVCLGGFNSCNEHMLDPDCNRDNGRPFE